jgi:hypothetical protein
MAFRFTKYSLTNALLSLIPVFPMWTVIPGVMAAAGLGKLLENCERGYQILLWTIIVLTPVLILTYISKINKVEEEWSESQIESEFRAFSLLLYTLINTSGLILTVGTDLACNGDGQTILAVLYSGPIASAALVAAGLIFDFTVKKQEPVDDYEP